jgi:hypothetical protein
MAANGSQELTKQPLARVCTFRTKIILTGITTKVFYSTLGFLPLDLTGDFCFSGERDTVLSGGCLKQVFFFRSVSDPDPDWIPI